MSSVRFKATKADSTDDSDMQLGFCDLSSSLHRPSDHFRPPRSSTNPYMPPPRARHAFAPHQLAARFIRDPVSTTLSSFSRVANFANTVWHPHEEYDVDYDTAFDLLTPTPDAQSKSPSQGRRNGQSSRVRENGADGNDDEVTTFKPPPPTLPDIPCSVPQNRLPKLQPEEYETQWANSSNEDLLKRIFQGGIASKDLKQKLWPLVLGLTDKHNEDFKWDELERTYELYENQWKAILPDQETRFTAYRERKSIIVRDVVRCDRSHPFYKDDSENLEKLHCLLMTYIMYDFDTGYVQGMTDLAAPLLYVWNGDVKRAFWCFVKVMELFKRNFEMSQSTMSCQLKMLWKLIGISDPCFAQYLASNESDNFYFAFRWIICQFKREFMKGKTDGYDDCLIVWETIWSANALSERFISKSEATGASDGNPVEGDSIAAKSDSGDSRHAGDGSADRGEVMDTADITGTPPPPAKGARLQKQWTSSESTAESRLKNIELFVLSICLSIIRRERDIIMAEGLDACEILKHFNTLQLNDDLGNILNHASSIWHWIKHDGGEQLLYPKEQLEEKLSDNAASDDFDLLNDDFMLLNTFNV
ncbi:TBC1 domain family member 15 [Halotydeus destructor]|nr:TBC1 domain family member 15 [Halotydeus destructor]